LYGAINAMPYSSSHADSAAGPKGCGVNDDFFAELSGFDNFRGITEPGNYQPAPDDWSVVHTDVVDSTQAIAGGHYKDVNMISVASIVCAQRVVGDLKFPFVFGGDGATMLVPQRFQNDVLAALLGLQSIARSRLNLDIRVGAVNVGELAADGHPVRVAKHHLSAAQNIAILEGAGLEEAERRIRAHPETYRHEVSPEEDTDLSGLSCRWKPVPSQRGRVVSLIMQTRSTRSGLYQELLERLDQVIGPGLDNVNPIGAPWMSYRSILDCIRDERRYYQGFSRDWFNRVVEIVFAVALFKYRFPGIGFDPHAYKRQLRTHSDFRKYDNVLRMTLDCSTSEIDAIRRLCDAYYEAGELYYGLHENDSALMTCFLNGTGEGEHLHFVDATDGGYTTAASQLKRQLAGDNAGGS
jgi:hypothetical protein